MKLNQIKKFLILCTFVVTCIVASKTVYAEEFNKEYALDEETTVTMTYVINDDGTVTLDECNGLKSGAYGIRIPETVTYNGNSYTITALGERAFYCKEGLYVLEIPKTVKTIGKSCFNYCENLSKVTFAGDGLEVIEEQAFWYCPLESFTFPNTVTTIGRDAFSYAKFSSIVIPGSVTTCGESPFSGVTTLKKVTFGEGITTLWSKVLDNTEGITTIELPSTLTTIERDALSLDITLDTLVLPESLALVKAHAFSGLTVKTLVVHSKKVVLEEDALNGFKPKAIQCYYGTAFYNKYKNSKKKITFLENPMVIENPSITMGVGSKETVQLVGTGNIAWKSSNKKVATVNSKGVVTAKKKGSVTITATCDGKTATCKIKVKANERKLQSYSKKVSKYGKNQVFFKYSKVKIDSKGNCIISGHFFNTTKKTFSKASVYVGVYKNGSRIARQSVSVKVKSKPKSVTKVTLKIKKKHVTKYTNLCDGKVYARDNGVIFCK